MPYKPRKPCREPCCPNLCEGSYCEKHASLHPKQETRNKSARALYQTKRWRIERSKFLKANPLCSECQKRGMMSPATVIDHITPHRGDEQKFFDQRNWQPLCKSCHDYKTGKFESNQGKRKVYGY